MGKAATKQGVNAEQGKEVRGHSLAGELLRAVVCFHGGDRSRDGSHPGEDIVLIVPVLEIQRGDAIVSVVSGLLPHHRETVWLGERERTKQRGIHDSEDRSQRTNAKGNETGSKQRESGSAQQEACSIANVLRDCVHDLETGNAATPLT